MNNLEPIIVVRIFEHYSENVNIASSLVPHLKNGYKIVSHSIAPYESEVSGDRIFYSNVHYYTLVL